MGGFVVHLDPAKRIVLAPRSNGWPRRHYPIAEFTLTPVATGTRLDFAQYGIPASDYAGIRDGWRTYYWKPMKRHFEG